MTLSFFQKTCIRRPFTFLELLLAFFLLTVVMAPLWSFGKQLLHHRSFENEARKLVSALQQAQQVMLYSHKDVSLCLKQTRQGVCLSLTEGHTLSQQMVAAIGPLPICCHLKLFGLQEGEETTLSFASSQWSIPSCTLVLQPLTPIVNRNQILYLHLHGIPHPFTLSQQAETQMPQFCPPKKLQDKVNQTISSL